MVLSEPHIIVAEFLGSDDLIKDRLVKLRKWSPPLFWVAKIFHETEFHTITLRSALIGAVRYLSPLINAKEPRKDNLINSCGAGVLACMARCRPEARTTSRGEAFANRVFTAQTVFSQMLRPYAAALRLYEMKVEVKREQVVPSRSQAPP